MVVPPAIFLHTLAVVPSALGMEEGGEIGYVTHILGAEDNIKARGSAADVKWAGTTVESACQCLSIDSSNVWAGGQGSLWDARLFPVASTRQESAHLSLSFLAAASAPRPLELFLCLRSCLSVSCFFCLSVVHMSSQYSTTMSCPCVLLQHSRGKAEFSQRTRSFVGVTPTESCCKARKSTARTPKKSARNSRRSSGRIEGKARVCCLN
mmetsp:Transcript_33934/g.85802  ORF Transcript_33934/g.85802 Transcript_33934/m.85802 type:complete len:209 (-) Transcript_33934:1337-1963(-)